MSILPGLRILVIVAATCAMAQGKIMYVSTAGSDAGDGLSWGTAKKTVQAGLIAATSGDQVWVAAGTYVERITLVNGVGLYGGFAGSETDMSQRNWGTNVTILDGNQTGSVVTGPTGTTTSTRIDGFTVRNGNASNGGGIYCNSAATITNNTISGNTASASGGGICSTIYSSSLTITNNTISRNTASNGGGICCPALSATIASNTITDNAASSYGGGIYCDFSSPSITNNIITSNTASNGGGIGCLSSSPAIANNTIAGNTASACGGGVGSWASHPGITSTIVAFNSSGIYDCFPSRSTLRDCCVYGNNAYNYKGLTDPTGTNGNISVDPGFVLTPSAGPDGIWWTADDVPGDLHLAAGSPCINAGDPAYVPVAGATDMDSQPRVIGGRVDIGADEFCLVGDANFDGYVNVGDLQLLIQSWAAQQGDANYNPAVDFNGDGFVNVADLQVLVSNWGAGL